MVDLRGGLPHQEQTPGNQDQIAPRKSWPNTLNSGAVS
jgi:hypothetical protein